MSNQFVKLHKRTWDDKGKLIQGEEFILNTDKIVNVEGTFDNCSVIMLDKGSMEVFEPLVVMEEILKYLFTEPVCMTKDGARVFQD